MEFIAVIVIPVATPTSELQFPLRIPVYYHSSLIYECIIHELRFVHLYPQGISAD